MMRVVKYFIGGLFVAAALLAAVSYSWTYTPLGRLDYQAAVLSRLAALQTEEAALTPAYREQTNAMTLKLMPSDKEFPLARVEDRTVEGVDGN